MAISDNELVLASEEGEQGICAAFVYSIIFGYDTIARLMGVTVAGDVCATLMRKDWKPGLSH